MNSEFKHIEENEIKYLVHPKGNVFEGMKIRENPNEAFENAIKKGMKNPENWMYMYSKDNMDYFKNIETRDYKSYSQLDIKEKNKRKFFYKDKGSR